eukprot:6073997-Amphidinium_carterae.1
MTVELGMLLRDLFQPTRSAGSSLTLVRAAVPLPLAGIGSEGPYGCDMKLRSSGLTSVETGRWSSKAL